MRLIPRDQHLKHLLAASAVTALLSAVAMAIVSPHEAVINILASLFAIGLSGAIASTLAVWWTRRQDFAEWWVARAFVGSQIATVLSPSLSIIGSLCVRILRGNPRQGGRAERLIVRFEHSDETDPFLLFPEEAALLHDALRHERTARLIPPDVTSYRLNDVKRVLTTILTQLRSDYFPLLLALQLSPDLLSRLIAYQARVEALIRYLDRHDPASPSIATIHDIPELTYRLADVLHATGWLCEHLPVPDHPDDH